jgi:hypothetical protein
MRAEIELRQYVGLCNLQNGTRDSTPVAALPQVSSLTWTTDETRTVLLCELNNVDLQPGAASAVWLRRGRVRKKLKLDACPQSGPFASRILFACSSSPAKPPHLPPAPAVVRGKANQTLSVTDRLFWRFRHTVLKPTDSAAGAVDGYQRGRNLRLYGNIHDGCPASAKPASQSGLRTMQGTGRCAGRCRSCA